MAIKHEYSTEHGFYLPDAYWKVEYFRGDRNITTIIAVVYKDQQARIEGKQPIGNIEFTMPTPQDNQDFFASVYDYMKANELTVTQTGRSHPFQFTNPIDV